MVRVLKSNLFFAVDFYHNFKAAKVHSIGFFSFSLVLLIFTIAQNKPDSIDDNSKEDYPLYIETAYTPVRLLTISIVEDLNRLVESILLVIDSQVSITTLIHLGVAVLYRPR